MQAGQGQFAEGSRLVTREHVLHGGVLALLTALAWLALIYASVEPSWGKRLSHEALLGSGAPPFEIALPLFLAAWVVMSAAMMLPTVWPVLDRFIRAARLRPTRIFLSMTALFVWGYLAVWAGFGLLAFVGDLLLHRVVDAWAPGEAVEPFIAPGTVLLAGAFQWSPLKWACLSQCQSPLSFLVRYWRPGLAGALALGVRHGLYCLGCCWALMLLMFGVGLTNLAWMLGLSVLFYLEKVVARGQALSRVTGAGLLVIGGVMLVATLG